MPSKKNLRRERVLESIGVQLADKTINPKTAARLLYEAQRIKFYLDGGKKKNKTTTTL